MTGRRGRADADGWWVRAPACEDDAGGATVTTPSSSAGRGSGAVPRAGMTADPETLSAAPVSDPCVAGPADRSALLVAAGGCRLGRALCIPVMAPPRAP